MKLLYTKLSQVLREFHFAQILAGKGKKNSIWPFKVESGEKISKRRFLGFLINECL